MERVYFFSSSRSFLIAYWNIKCDVKKIGLLLFLFATTIIITTHTPPFDLLRRWKFIWAAVSCVYCIPNIPECFTSTNKYKNVQMVVFFFVWLLFFIRFSLWAGGCKAYILLSLFGWTFLLLSLLSIRFVSCFIKMRI